MQTSTVQKFDQLNAEVAPLFSVIMPVYNTDNLVEAAIRSVLDQSIADLEMIVIDDGSTDGSVAVCERLAQEDRRIRLLRKENGGQGLARNLGLGHASGRYLLFIDSDDTMHTGLLARVLAAFKENKADAVCFGFEYYDTNGRRVAMRSVEANFVQNGAEIFQDAMLDRNFLSSPCSKAYRRALIEEHGIRFPPLRAYEDALFSRHFAYHATRVVYIPDILYRVLTRSGSTTRALSVRNFEIASMMIAEERTLFQRLIGPAYDGELFGAHVVRFFAQILILAAFRIPDRQERHTCLAIADACGFSTYAARTDVQRLLPRRTKLQLALAQRPALARFAARQAQRLGINPY